jgi:hypothetical protein
MLAHRRVFRRNAFPDPVQMKQGPAGVQHGAGRTTDRSAGATRNVRIRERGPHRHQAVHVGRPDFRVTQRAYGVKALVVGKDKKRFFAISSG